MPNLYKFKPINCSKNTNFEKNTIAGCKYIPIVKEFKPHNKPKPPHPPHPPHPPGPGPGPGPGPPSTNANEDKIISKLPTISNIKPLKNIDKLTPEKIAKGKMVAAAYELVKDDIRLGNQETGNVKFEDMDLVAKSRRSADTSEFLKKSGVDHYRVVRDYSDRNVMVLNGRGPEEGNIKLVFKGLAGEQSTPAEIKHMKDTIYNNKKDYEYLDDLYKKVNTEFPNSNIELVSYSNGGAKAMYLGEKYKLPHYSIDPLLGKNELNILMNRPPESAPLEFVRTARPAMAMGTVQTLQEILQSKAPYKTTITTIEPLVGAPSNPFSKAVYDHNLQSYIKPDTARNSGFITRGSLGSVFSGVAPIALAQYVTEQINPDANTAVKIAETSVGGSALTKIISPLVGAGAAPMSATLAPIAGSLITAEGANAIADVILPEDMEQIPRQTLSGAFTGAAGGLGFVGTQAIGSAAKTAISSISLGGEAVAAEGVELATLGAAAEATETTALLGEGATAAAEGIEMAEIGGGVLEGIEAVNAGLAAATEATGAVAGVEGGLNPVADAVFLGTAIAAGTGALVGGLIGLISGATQNNQNTQTLKPEYIQAQNDYNKAKIEEQKRIQAIRNAPAAPKGSHVLETIANDPDYKRLMKEGTFEEVNNHIRDLVYHYSMTNADFDGVKQGFDLYPVLLPDGTWTSQQWDDPLPSTPSQTKTPVFSNVPYPNTSNTHIEPSSFTDTPTTTPGV